MKIAVTSMGLSLDDQVEARFGRTPYYIFVDSETMEYEAVENPNVAAGGGVGILSAQLMADHGVQCVLTGNCGPNAFQVFNAAGIQVVVGVTGTIRRAIEQFNAGSIAAASQPSVVSHFGMGSGRGMGSGQGIGRGVSRGRVLDRGMDRGARQTPASGNAGVQPKMTKDEEIAFLREQANDLGRQIRDMERRIDRAQTGKVGIVAHVDVQTCTGCGICVDFCPVGAIAVSNVAVVDAHKCIGCGACVDECPFGAISMS